MSKYMTKMAEQFEATIANGAALSDVLDVREFTNFVVIIPSAWTAANLGIQVSDKSDGTFVVLRDKTGSAVEVSGIATSASKAYALPTEVAGCGFIKLWSKNTSSEANVNQGAARTLVLLAKS